MKVVLARRQKQSNMISFNDFYFIKKNSMRKNIGKYITENNCLCPQNVFSMASMNTFLFILRVLLLILACEENCKIFSRKPSKKLESQNNSKKDTSKNLVEKKAFYFKADITIKPPNLLMPENRYKLLLCTYLMSNISY